MFNIHNDLPSAINRDLIIFADDITAILKNKSNAELFTSLPAVMKDIEICCSKNGLKLNFDLKMFCEKLNYI